MEEDGLRIAPREGGWDSESQDAVVTSPDVTLQRGKGDWHSRSPPEWLRLMISITLPPGSKGLQALHEQAVWAVSAARECWVGTFLLRADPSRQETRPRRCCQSWESHILRVRGSALVRQHTSREAKGGALAYRAVCLAWGWKGKREKGNCTACSFGLWDFWCTGKL